MRNPKAKESIPYDTTPVPPMMLSEPAVPYPASEPSFLDLVRMGVPRKRVTEVQAGLGLSQNIMASLLHMSERTLQRYEEHEMMDAQTTEKLLLLENLKEHGKKVFGNEAEFTAWLQEELPALGFKRPVSYLDTFTGLQTIDQLLGRLEWGMY